MTYEMNSKLTTTLPALCLLMAACIGPPFAYGESPPASTVSSSSSSGSDPLMPSAGPVPADVFTAAPFVRSIVVYDQYGGGMPGLPLAGTFDLLAGSEGAVTVHEEIDLGDTTATRTSPSSWPTRTCARWWTGSAR